MDESDKNVNKSEKTLGLFSSLKKEPEDYNDDE